MWKTIKSYGSRAILAILLVLVVACGGAPAPSPTIAPSPLPTHTPLSPTLSPTATTVPTSTPLANWADLTPYRTAMVPQAQGDIEQLVNPTRYFIDLTLDMEGPTLIGHQRMLYTNNEAVELDKLYFRLFPNAPSYGGSMEIEHVVVDGKEVRPVYELSNSAMKIPLAEPLPPGERLEIAIDFRVSVPRSTEHGYGQFCYVDNVLALPNFYPLVPVYDDEGWNVELAPDYGDAVYSDVSLYLVRLTVPREMVVATSGSAVSKVENADGTVTWTYASGPMRDFCIVMSEEYEVASDTVGQTTVNSYYLPRDREGGQRVLRYARDALRVYSQRFGLYPYAELDVVETPTTAGGIEYPGLIVIAQRYYGQEGGFFEFATAHEVAHQWWYGMVGSDQVDEPWLDEALTNYSALIYFEDVYGEEVAEAILEGYFEGPYQRAIEERRDAVVAQPVAAFSPEDYGLIVYAKGALFFHALRQEVGDEVYFEIMRRYLEEHKYKIATPESFLAVAEAVAGRSLRGIYRHWILSAERRK